MNDQANAIAPFAYKRFGGRTHGAGRSEGAIRQDQGPVPKLDSWSSDPYHPDLSYKSSPGGADLSRIHVPSPSLYREDIEGE
jgi:hypothetical protein